MMHNSDAPGHSLPLHKLRQITIILVVLISLYLIFDAIRSSALFFENPRYYALKAKNGNYVRCNLKKGGFLFADSYQIGSWEQFSHRGSGNEYAPLLSREGKRIIANDHNSVRGIQSGPSNSDRWKIVVKEDSVLVGDKNGRYWNITGDSRVVTGSRNQADAFICIEMKKVIPIMDYSLILIGFFLLGTAIVLFQTPVRPVIALMLLMAASFVLTFYGIRLFNFLMIWDEQYHALIAKNLISHPFTPMFYPDPILPYDYKNWIGNHIWVHKPPLFLWQMALSIWVFGAKAWAVRVPDLVMTVLLVPVIYRMGRIIVDNRTGFWAAVFFTVSHFLFELSTGSIFTDHNDFAFIFYITLSIWSWLEYEFSTGKNGQLRFVLLTGLFAGAAILVKWLPGLLVYSGWGLAIITSATARKKIKSYVHLLLGLLITVIVSLPWQIYILTRFPQESKFEFQFFTNHFSQPLDGHNGDGLGWHYYLSNFSDIFSVSLLTWLLLSVIFLLIINRRPIGYGLLGMVVIVFTFYSIAATKMPAFPVITISVILLVYATLFSLSERIIPLFVPGRFLQILLMTCIVLNVAVCQYRLNDKYSNYYTERGNRESCISQRAMFAGLYREFSSIVPMKQQPSYVILNCPWEEIPHLMFFTDVRAAYDKIDDNKLNFLKSRKDLKIGYIVISDQPIPENILRDDSILKIRFSKPISLNDLGKCLH